MSSVALLHTLSALSTLLTLTSAQVSIPYDAQPSKWKDPLPLHPAIVFVLCVVIALIWSYIFDWFCCKVREFLKGGEGFKGKKQKKNKDGRGKKGKGKEIEGRNPMGAPQGPVAEIHR